MNKPHCGKLHTHLKKLLPQSLDTYLQHQTLSRLYLFNAQTITLNIYVQKSRETAPSNHFSILQISKFLEILPPILNLLCNHASHHVWRPRLRRRSGRLHPRRRSPSPHPLRSCRGTWTFSTTLLFMLVNRTERIKVMLNRVLAGVLISFSANICLEAMDCSCPMVSIFRRSARNKWLDFKLER